MPVIEIKENKIQYMDLLLLGDEQASMIDGYLIRGRLFVLKEGDVKGLCLVTDEGSGVLEVKNIAVYPAYQRQGYGRQLLDYIERAFHGTFSVLRVGTGDSPLTMRFYETQGFKEARRIHNFFIDNYDKPIFERGKQLMDMIVLEKII